MTYKAINFGEPRYLVDMPTPLIRDSGAGLHSGNDPNRLHEPMGALSRLDHSLILHLDYTIGFLWKWYHELGL